MQIITSWLKINRSLGAVIGITVLFCALLALGKAPSKSSTHVSIKPSAPTPKVPSTFKIALVAADNASWASEVQSKLVATGRFSQVDIIDGGSTTPSVDQLRGY